MSSSESSADLMNRLSIAMEEEKEEMKAENAALKAQVKELMIAVDALNKEKETFIEDHDAMADRIAQLEAKLKARATGATGAAEDAGDQDDDAPDYTDPPDVPEDDPDKSVNEDDIPLIVAPEWRVSNILKRIKEGDRITLNNFQWIELYSTENRVLHALKFRARVIKAYKQMCLRFAKDHTLPTNDNTIPTDFEVVKHDLKKLATLNDHAFIRAMFKVEY